MIRIEGIPVVAARVAASLEVPGTVPASYPTIDLRRKRESPSVANSKTVLRRARVSVRAAA
jgi:hypothetical protein